MQIPPLQALSTSTAANAASNVNRGQDMSNMFMQLLMAQLKSQSPLNPLDPNQFVGQLAQFNSLSELVQIREILQQLTIA